MSLTMSDMTPALRQRYQVARELAGQAATRGLEFYRNRFSLQVEHKDGDQQDVVSLADRELEFLIREGLQKAFPEDGILGEEGGERGERDPALEEHLLLRRAYIHIWPVPGCLFWGQCAAFRFNFGPLC